MRHSGDKRSGDNLPVPASKRHKVDSSQELEAEAGQRVNSFCPISSDSECDGSIGFSDHSPINDVSSSQSASSDDDVSEDDASEVSSQSRKRSSADLFGPFSRPISFSFPKRPKPDTNQMQACDYFIQIFKSNNTNVGVDRADEVAKNLKKLDIKSLMQLEANMPGAFTCLARLLDKLIRLKNDQLLWGCRTHLIRQCDSMNVEQATSLFKTSAGAFVRLNVASHFISNEYGDTEEFLVQPVYPSDCESFINDLFDQNAFGSLDNEELKKLLRVHYRDRHGNMNVFDVTRHLQIALSKRFDLSGKQDERTLELASAVVCFRDIAMDCTRLKHFRVGGYDWTLIKSLLAVLVVSDEESAGAVSGIVAAVLQRLKSGIRPSLKAYLESVDGKTLLTALLDLDASSNWVFLESLLKHDVLSGLQESEFRALLDIINDSSLDCRQGIFDWGLGLKTVSDQGFLLPFLLEIRGVRTNGHHRLKFCYFSHRLSKTSPVSTFDVTLFEGCNRAKKQDSPKKSENEIQKLSRQISTLKLMR